MTNQPNPSEGSDPATPIGETTEPSADAPVAPKPTTMPIADTAIAPPAVADAGRRRFFRDFAGEMLNTAASVVGAASVLQRSSLAAATALLDPEGTAETLAANAGVAGTERPSGFRTAFRFEADNRLIVVDQRRIPEALVEYEVRSAGHAAYAIRQLVVSGGPAAAQIAAIGLALSAHGVRDASPTMVRANLKAAASALRAARPALRAVSAAIDRMMARYEALAALDATPDAVADELRAEADRIVAEATFDNGRIADAAAAALPTIAKLATHDATLRILTHGSTGALSSGQFGTAVGAIQVLHHANRPVHAWIAETRPTFAGSRVTAWELGQAGVAHTVVIDSAAPNLIASGEVDVVVVGGERIATNGDVLAPVGTYSLALAAARHRVPFVVCAPLNTFDPDAAAGDAFRVEVRPERELVGSWVMAVPSTMPIGTPVRNTSLEVVPADLVTLLVTEQGALAGPLAAPLAAAVASRAARAATTAAAPAAPTQHPASAAPAIDAGARPG